MKKRALLLALAVIMVLSLGSAAPVNATIFGARQVRTVLFGETRDGLQAVLFEGKTYIPLAALEGLLGLNVQWDESTSTILINSYLDSELKLPKGLEYRGYPRANIVIDQKVVAPTPPAIVFGGKPYMPLRVLEQLGITIGWDQRTQTAYVGTLTTSELPLVGSQSNMEKLFGSQMYPRLMYKATMDTVTGAPESSGQAGARDESTGHSETNVQVAGVDEADIVKTDGHYIYQVQANQVIITQAYPANEMKVVRKLTFTDPNFTPSELFIDEKHMLVIGQSNNNAYYEELPETITKRGIDEEPSFAPEMKMMPGLWYRGNSTVKAIAYDISDKANITLVREVELEGYLLTSRKVGSHVYLLSNKDMGYGIRPLAPLYKDSKLGEEYVEIEFDDVRYFPEGSYPNYLLIAAFDLNDIGGGSVVDAYIGAGSNVYMSKDSLYIAVGKYNNNTALYKFEVEGTDVDYVAKGEVPGYILNQFSMDEHEEHFRIATTDWKDNRSTNNVYVLNGEMKLSGKIEDIAPGERIYAARFMGDKGYLVTFEQVDPLFVLDLKNPERPEILGALKIPGFSNYLHPLDENHLLGIGKDTQLMDRKDHTGAVVGQFVVEKGMKLAIFDVSDVTNPLEKHSIVVGGKGTYSEVLYNHKALLFNTQSDLLAFPVTIYKDGDDVNWGAFEFQGAVVYDVNLENGFGLKGKISHISSEEYAKAGQYWGGGDSEVKRTLYIGENLYVVSGSAISAHDIDNLVEVNKVVINK